MYLNLLHRPVKKNLDLFRFQQDIAHELNLKVTLQMSLSSLYEDEMVAIVRKYSEEFGDEIGIWFSQFHEEVFKDARNACPFWLYSEEDKREIISAYIDRFRKVFNCDPISAGAYHMDAVSIRILKEICPSVKITVAGCFEEGVKVFHGCNNSWYLFNEGMPWGPWYPSRTNSLRPAENPDEAFDIVAVPHLSRDLALSYEGRNDFFASHPANVQRGMANEGAICPYNFNLVDIYRLQEDFNNGLSYYSVYVSPSWLSGNPNIQDSDEITQKLYRDLLEYFAELKSKGQLVDMYMREFAEWFRENVPVGKPQLYLAKEILYGSGKHYFWYVDPYMRVLIDAEQGGSIGDFRPYAGKLERFTGPDSPNLAMGSYPYLIHSQYRTGIAHHYADGTRTTLMVKHGEETIDLCTCRTRVADIVTEAGGTHMKLTPANLTFKNGLTVSIETIYHFKGKGKIIIERSIVEMSDEFAILEFTEYFKGSYGETEYPQDMHGISLSVDGDVKQHIMYEYKSRTIETENAKSVSAVIPQVNTEVKLSILDKGNRVGRAVEGHLFNPHYLLAVDSKVKIGNGVRTCLEIRKIK